MKTYRYKINGNDYEVAINYVSGNSAQVTVNGRQYNVDMSAAEAASRTQAPVSSPAQPRQASVPADAGTGKTVKSPLPGVIVSIPVAPGDTVKEGQVVAVLEAMKMENEIQAEYSGTVMAVNVAQGDSVLEGAVIVTIG